MIERGSLNDDWTSAVGLRQSAATALFWSLAQSWLGRALAAIVFVLLARLLRPTEIGIAASTLLVLSLFSLITEFGFGDALVQRARLSPEDINLPFYVSVGCAALLGGVGMAVSYPLSTALGVPALAPYLVGALALLPLMAISGFQEALYRRALRFRELALRTLAGVVLGGMVGVGAAIARLGPSAIIAQFATQTLVSIVFLWRGALWRPGLRLEPASFREIAGFGANLVGMRIVDFVTVRSVDVLILSFFGPAALGLYAVSSRLYQLLMQLFQTSISSVGLSILSRLTDDMARLRRLFLRSSSISAMVGTPVFVGLAALAPEVNRIMFGAQWAGADTVMRPLLLIGGLHCIQFTMGAYLTAVGRPGVLLQLMILKAGMVLLPFLFIRPGSVAGVATLYAAALACELPFILGATLRALNLKLSALLQPVGIPLAASVLAFGVAVTLRANGALPTGPVLSAILIGSAFVLTYAAVLAFVPKAVLTNIVFLLDVLKRYS